MAMIPTVTQVGAAMYGRSTTFVVAVQNTGGSTVSINSLSPVVTTPSGLPASAVNIGQVSVTPELGNAQVGGSQFNVPVTAGSTVYLPFQLQFFGNPVNGAPARATNQFLVSAQLGSSDNTFATSPQLLVGLADPTWGLQPGSPPNATPLPSGGMLQFNLTSNSAFIF